MQKYILGCMLNALYFNTLAKIKTCANKVMFNLREL